MRQMPGPVLVIKNYVTASVFYHATEVPRLARSLLALASNFRTHGGNLYELCDNASIALTLGIGYQQLMRCKRQLRDAGLLDYDGNFGDMTHIIRRWEKRTGEQWEFSI